MKGKRFFSQIIGNALMSVGISLVVSALSRQARAAGQVTADLGEDTEAGQETAQETGITQTRGPAPTKKRSLLLRDVAINV